MREGQKKGGESDGPAERKAGLAPEKRKEKGEERSGLRALGPSGGMN